jgi:hypothetical protein
MLRDTCSQALEIRFTARLAGGELLQIALIYWIPGRNVQAREVQGPQNLRTDLLDNSNNKKVAV